MSVNTHSKLQHASRAVDSTILQPIPEFISLNITSFAILEQFYPILRTALLNEFQKRYELLDEEKNYLQQMFDTNCLGGKYNRGVAVVETVRRALVTAAAPLPDATVAGALCQAAAAGWVIEFLQAHFLVEDDIMDQSHTRRGRPCWFRYPGVGTALAINDGMLLYGCCPIILEQWVPQEAVRQQLLDLLKNTYLDTIFGQFYDVSMMIDRKEWDIFRAPSSQPAFHQFTPQSYHRIVIFKTAYYSFYLPLAFGELLSRYMAHALRVPQGVLQRLALIMGKYFQIQDDVFDAFADAATLGKIGTDIQDAKCSWLAVTFLQRCTDAQRDEFLSLYGKDDSTKIESVKKMYRDGGLLQQFDEYANTVKAIVEKEIGDLELQHQYMAEAVSALWNKTYNRKK